MRRGDEASARLIFRAIALGDDDAERAPDLRHRHRSAPRVSGNTPSAAPDSSDAAERAGALDLLRYVGVPGFAPGSSPAGQAFRAHLDAVLHRARHRAARLVARPDPRPRPVLRRVRDRARAAQPSVDVRDDRLLGRGARGQRARPRVRAQRGHRRRPPRRAARDAGLLPRRPGVTAARLGPHGADRRAVAARLEPHPRADLASVRVRPATRAVRVRRRPHPRPRRPADHRGRA